MVELVGRRLPLRAVAEAGMLIALATVLSFIKIFTLPQGGSVTAASMVPILLFAVRWGPGPGVLAGAAYGLIQLWVEPFILHPAQVVLDYPLAFGLLGLAGLFPARPALGVMAGMIGRFLSHWLSGFIFFAAFAGDQHPMLYSAIYNGSYLLPELAISALLVALLAPSLRTKVTRIA
ncbi:MAG TPA: energy-coupled thiamine transporter ThiT [Bacillota bacterium]|nr:energy-coupled thiamine transporter ThiT [Bacillota bacterium]